MAPSSSGNVHHRSRRKDRAQIHRRHRLDLARHRGLSQQAVRMFRAENGVASWPSWWSARHSRLVEPEVHFDIDLGRDRLAVFMQVQVSSCELLNRLPIDAFFSLPIMNR